ncbi:MAG: hypothetical protein J7J36_05175 [Thermoplasmata archaeon]|nr:hypothetical protein [Thermoplasmata archaeon]
MEDENMNKALEEWAKEHDVKIEKDSKEEEIDGMCEICGIREAKHVCIKCGRKVCSADFWTMLGICKLCLPEAEMKKWRKEHPF